MAKLTKDFYLGEDVVQISKDLLGKRLFTEIDGRITAGKIVETEAYAGVVDKASHAYGDRRTKRTEVIYSEGGVSYVYLCYGIHYLFNIVTHKKETPHAVLVRAIEPLEGIDIMLQRRKKEKLMPNIASGPGSLTQALGINLSHNETCLISGNVWLEEGEDVSEKNIIASPRVGIAYAEEHAALPWRFRIKGNKWAGK